jgi:heptosyltransferase II
MPDNFFSNGINNIFRKYFSAKEISNYQIDNAKKFLIVRQHNQLGDLLAGVSLFRAIKESVDGAEITVIGSPINYQGLIKNKFIDRLFVFDKKKLVNPVYVKSFKKLLGEQYDVTIVPVVVSISFTSNLIAGLSNSKLKIGPKSLDGKENKSSYFFNCRIPLDWRMHPDSNVSERSLDIIRPFGINTKNFKSEISFDNEDLEKAKLFIKEEIEEGDRPLIGLHVGAGKEQNRWNLEKYVKVISELKEKYRGRLYLTGSFSDKSELDYIKGNIPFRIPVYFSKPIPEIAALISLSSLFISNDTGIMHVAGTTDTPQISIFGPTNPFNWAPIGPDKYFLRNSDFIDDVTTEDVLGLADKILKKL